MLTTASFFLFKVPRIIVQRWCCRGWEGLFASGYSRGLKTDFYGWMAQRWLNRQMNTCASCCFPAKLFTQKHKSRPCHRTLCCETCSYLSLSVIVLVSNNYSSISARQILITVINPAHHSRIVSADKVPCKLRPALFCSSKAWQENTHCPSDQLSKCDRMFQCVLGDRNQFPRHELTSQEPVRVPSGQNINRMKPEHVDCNNSRFQTRETKSAFTTAQYCG